jgi:hypothetical protein
MSYIYLTNAQIFKIVAPKKSAPTNTTPIQQRQKGQYQTDPLPIWQRQKF